MPAEIGKDVQKAKALLEKGELVAIPTETVYGLAANALDPVAVLKIFEAKKRPFFDPLIVHIPGSSAVSRYAAAFPEWASELIEEFWPGPLTILTTKSSAIPDIVTSGLDIVGLRVPNHPLTLDLLSSLDFPLAAPSANPFGYISPTTPKHVWDQLQGEIPYILDGGICDVGVESTIIGEENGEITVYRLGGVSVQEIEKVVGEVQMNVRSGPKPIAPGTLESHYAPKHPLILNKQYDPQNVAVDTMIFDPLTVGALRFSSVAQNIPAAQQRVLSYSADLHEAARNLFSALRDLDQMNVTMIFAEQVPEEGLGLAINDRLRRAAAKVPRQ